MTRPTDTSMSKQWPKCPTWCKGERLYWSRLPGLRKMYKLRIEWYLFMKLRLWKGYPIIKTVMRYDTDNRIFRLFRVFSNYNGKGYSWKWSLALSPRLFNWQRGWHEFRLTICGIRFHYQRSYGGNFV